MMERRTKTKFQQAKEKEEEEGEAEQEEGDNNEYMRNEKSSLQSSDRYCVFHSF